MVVENKSDSLDKHLMLQCSSMENVLRLLTSLQTTSAGGLVYKQMTRVLQDYQDNQNKISYGFAALAHKLMSAYRKQLPKESLLYLELELVQRRLMPPISLSELSTLYNYFKKVLPLLGTLTSPDQDIIREALAPILKPGQLEQQTVAATAASTVRDTITTPANTPPLVQMQVNSLFQQRLNKHYHEILNLQINLSKKIEHTTLEHQRFGVALESARVKFEQQADTSDVATIRTLFVEQIQSLIKSQQELTQILHDTQAYLHLVGNNSKKLSEELDQVRVLSLTDDLTGLPNRRAFIRRVQDEVLRSDREKTPMTLVFLDLDNFKAVNDRYGRATGDDILRTYANHILAVFRRYDTVSRYGGEKFGAILPNTDQTGAQHALNKILAKAHQTVFLHKGVNILVPTFSAGVAVHYPDESADALIERADQALCRAKESGRDRIEFDEEVTEITLHEIEQL